MSDAIAVLIWWLLLQAMGWVALPLVFRLLRWLPDRGYSVAKPAGLLLGNYVLWLLGTLGWLRNTAGGVLLAFGLAALFSAWVYQRWNDGPNLLDWLRAHRWWAIAYEAVFLIAFVAWAIFRAHNPDLSSTEKPMEFAFTNAIARSATFPPPDPWLSGFTISYYYFGYVMMSTLMTLSGVASGVAFSLSNALWFALTAAGAFGIVANLVAASKRATRAAIVSAGLLGALFVPVLGNYEAPLDVAHTNGIGAPEFWRWLDILEINTPPQAVSGGEARWPFCDNCQHPRGGWWFWRASRVVHDYPPGSTRSDPAEYQELIDEFPFFSFLLGDMHPHVLALPYALMSMALALNLFRLAHGSTSEDPAAGEPATSSSALFRASLRAAAFKRWFWEFAPIGLMYPIFLGALSFLNTWDFPIHVFIVALAWGVGRWLAGRQAGSPPARQIGWDALAALAACGLIGVAGYLPFYIGFRSQAAGIRPNLYNATQWQQFVVMFGPFLLIGAMFLLTLLARLVKQRRAAAGRLWLGVLGGGAGIVAAAVVLTAVFSALVLAVSSGERARLEEWLGSLDAQGINLSGMILGRLGDLSVPLLLGVGIAAVVALVRLRAPGSRSHALRLAEPAEEPATPFVLLLFGVGALLALAVEFVFLADQFGTRMNTVFKLYYQTWALWGVASAYAVYHLWQSSERLTSTPRRAAYAAILGVSIAAGLVYPLLAIPGKIDRGLAPTLDARAPTRQFAPDEVAAIEWLEENATGLPVILEADGASFRAETSRLSAWTGLPSVLGWVGHEGQWRGDYEDVSPRQQDIDRIYNTRDTADALQLLRKYNVTYVYVGPNELARYAPEGLTRLDAALERVFQQGNSTLYRVPAQSEAG
jgi:YYY domain-containing protein